jgi:hypothetical protein
MTTGQIASRLAELCPQGSSSPRGALPTGVGPPIWLAVAERPIFTMQRALGSVSSLGLATMLPSLSERYTAR